MQHFNLAGKVGIVTGGNGGIGAGRGPYHFTEVLSYGEKARERDEIGIWTPEISRELPLAMPAPVGPFSGRSWVRRQLSRAVMAERKGFELPVRHSSFGQIQVARHHPHAPQGRPHPAEPSHAWAKRTDLRPPSAFGAAGRLRRYRDRPLPVTGQISTSVSPFTT